MDTELLKTFLEVSRTRHFGRAAESLYLTQSAVSFRIRQLENQLGANLFTRHRNNIRLTPAGDRLLPYAENLINTWQLARKEVVRSQRHAEISIGGSALLWETPLNGWLQQLYQQNENLQIEARISIRQLLVQQLHERQLDLLITIEPPKMEELSSQLIGNFSLLYFTAKEGPKPEIRPYLKLEWGADFYQQENQLRGDVSLPTLHTTSAHLARKLLNTTGGYAFLPAQWADEYPELHANESIPPIIRPVYAVWLETSDRQPLIKHLLKMPLPGDDALL